MSSSGSHGSVAFPDSGLVRWAGRLLFTLPAIRLGFMATISFSEILRLSAFERIQLAQDIWDSVAAEAGADPADAVPMTGAQRQELDSRLADIEARPGAGRPRAKIKERLLKVLELTVIDAVPDSTCSPRAVSLPSINYAREESGLRERVLE